MTQCAIDCSMYCKVFLANTVRVGSGCRKQALMPIFKRSSFIYLFSPPYPPAPFHPRRGGKGSQQPYLALSFKETRTRATARCVKTKQLGDVSFETGRAICLNFKNSNGPNLTDARPLLRDKAKYGCWLPSRLLGSDTNFAAALCAAPFGEPTARRIWALTPKTGAGGSEWGKKLIYMEALNKASKSAEVQGRGLV